MCVIAIKRAGIKMPDENTLKTMWTNNPHGAGIMYARGGKVYIDKGYMDWTSFIGRIESLGDVTETLSADSTRHSQPRSRIHGAFGSSARIGRH